MSSLCEGNATAVARIWREHERKPHGTESYKFSSDPSFIEKLEDIIGLYLDSPEHAMAPSCGEMAQIQALDRTQPCRSSVRAALNRSTSL